MKKLSSISLFLFLTSCARPDQVSTRIPAQIPLLTPTATVTAVPATVISTLTLTASTDPTPFATWTPLPTLIDENSFLDFISFTKNSSCKVPCWAGVVPGKTLWDEAVFALHPMESVAKWNIYPGVDGLFGRENIITWSFSTDEVILNGDVGAILSDGNTINLINLSVEGSSMPSVNMPSHSLPLPTHFNLQSVLREYGVPSMVFIYTFIHEEPGPLPFQVLLIYPEHQFYILYHREAKLSGNNVVACDPDFYMKLTVVDNQEKLVSVDSITSALETQDLGLQNMKPVEQVLSISPEKFHEIYSASATECIIFPSNLWQP